MKKYINKNEWFVKEIFLKKRDGPTIQPVLSKDEGTPFQVKLRILLADYKIFNTSSEDLNFNSTEDKI